MKKPIKTKNQIKHKTLEDALMAFRHALTKALVDEAKEKGCTLSHFEVIKYVAEQGKPSMKDIARQLHITPPSTSTLVDSLVSKNLVSRHHVKEDRRTIRVTLAPAAHVLLTSIYKHKSSVFNKMLAKLSSKDKSELARILIKCI